MPQNVKRGFNNLRHDMREKKISADEWLQRYYDLKRMLHRWKEKRGHKRRLIDGVYYRKRRGKWVPIPPEWVGKTVHPQRVRKRKSKKGQGRKFRRKCQR